MLCSSIKMVTNRDITRVDTVKLKDIIYQKIGPQRAEDYFDHLKRFLSSKLEKADFDKCCIQTIGRENIALHNRLICAIIRNSNLTKPETRNVKPHKGERLGFKTSSGYQRSHFQSNFGNEHPLSPRKCRTPVNRERMFRDRTSPLGPLGKSPSLTYEETISRIQDQSTAELHSISSRPPEGVIAPVEEGEEVEQFDEILREWKSVVAPLGIRINSNLTPRRQNFDETCNSSGELPDNISLKSRLEKKLAADGISISLEGVDVINKGLDAFLIRLLKSYTGAFGGSHHRDQMHSNCQMMPRSNGISSNIHSQMQTEPTHLSMLGFRLAIEMNPSFLGENWPNQLEKISHHSFQ